MNKLSHETVSELVRLFDIVSFVFKPKTRKQEDLLIMCHNILKKAKEEMKAENE